MRFLPKIWHFLGEKNCAPFCALFGQIRCAFEFRIISHSVNKCAKKLELEKDKMDNSDVPEILTMSHFSTPLNQIGLGYGSPFISVPYNTPEGYRNQMMTPSIFQSPRLMSTFQTATNLNLRPRVPFTPTLTNASRLASSSWRQVPEMPSEISTPKISRNGVRSSPSPSSERFLSVPQMEVEPAEATTTQKRGKSGMMVFRFSTVCLYF